MRKDILYFVLCVLSVIPAKAEISQRIDAEENEMTASKVRVFENDHGVH